MRPTRISIAVLMLVGLLAPLSPARAARSHGFCQDSGNQATAGELTAFADPAGCTTIVLCPRKHRTDCTITLAGEVTGNGLVALTISVDGDPIGDCAETQSCQTGGEISLHPGVRTEMACDFGQGAAVGVEISCEWSSS